MKSMSGFAWHALMVEWLVGVGMNRRRLETHDSQAHDHQESRGPQQKFSRQAKHR
jgi:hypothetical protein